MSTDDPEAVVARFNEAWVAHDLNRTAALLTDDCTFEATGPAPDGTRHVGRAAVAEAWAALFSDPTSHFEAEETFVVGTGSFSAGATRGATDTCAGWTCSAVEGDRVAEKLSYVKG